MYYTILILGISAYIQYRKKQVEMGKKQAIIKPNGKNQQLLMMQRQEYHGSTIKNTKSLDTHRYRGFLISHNKFRERVCS